MPFYRHAWLGLHTKRKLLPRTPWVTLFISFLDVTVDAVWFKVLFLLEREAHLHTDTLFWFVLGFR